MLNRVNSFEGIALEPEERSLAEIKRSVNLVLLSTDDQMCIVVRSYLRHLGFCVFTYTSSVRAERQFIKKSDIDLWLVDVEALGVEAICFATRLHDLHSEVPIVLITGERQMGSPSRLFWKNLVRTRKPVELPDLLATIHLALAHRQRAATTKKQDGGLDRLENEWINKLTKPQGQNHLLN